MEILIKVKIFNMKIETNLFMIFYKAQNLGCFDLNPNSWASSQWLRRQKSCMAMDNDCHFIHLCPCQQQFKMLSGAQQPKANSLKIFSKTDKILHYGTNPTPAVSSLRPSFSVCFVFWASWNSNLKVPPTVIIFLLWNFLPTLHSAEMK